MTYSKLDPQPAGLSANETALQLDDGTLVAVAVVPTWLPNGAGVAFAGTARHIIADGTTQACPQGQDVQTGFTHAATVTDADTSDKIGAIAKEILLAMLGEPPTMTTVNGEEVPALPLSDEVRSNVNIRLHAAIAASTGTGAIDPATVLGLGS